MRIAVLIKQVPVAAELQLVDGRLVRDGVALEVNAYCRRANAKAVQLAGPEGEVVVFTMGPPAAADALREMLACGAHRAVHLCDPAFAGADTLATARALAAALKLTGPFDLVLAGLNSVDSDTGQVPPQLAALLDVPFLPAARELELDGRGALTAKLETTDGYRWAQSSRPAVVSAAERLCDPSKSNDLSGVADNRILRLCAADLPLSKEQLGIAGSPTAVGTPVTTHHHRSPQVATTVREVLDRLVALDAFAHDLSAPPDRAPGPRARRSDLRGAVWCWVDDGDTALLRVARVLADQQDASVVAVGPGSQLADLAAVGADAYLHLAGSIEPDDLAPVLLDELRSAAPWVALFPSTHSGRALAASVTAVAGWGLIGDALRVESDGGRLVGWKSALGGNLEIPITTSSPVQVATVITSAPIVADPPPEHSMDPLPGRRVHTPTRGRTMTTRVEHLDEAVRDIGSARMLIGVGQGVRPEEYPLLEPLRLALGGAPLVATRKVTDQGWLPRSRQVGITGRAVRPRLYVAVGLSGRYNHTVGVHGDGVVLAVNNDPEAPIHQLADVALVADWRSVIDELTSGISAALEAGGLSPGSPIQASGSFSSRGGGR